MTRGATATALAWLCACGPAPEFEVRPACDGCAPVATVTAACAGDNDGTIAAAELPVVAGTRLAYLANQTAPVPVDPDGQSIGGQWTWDFTEGPRDGAGVVEIRAADREWWFEEHFPTATHASTAGPTTPGLLTVFRSEEQRLLLLGVVSANPEPDHRLTRLIYDAPVVLYDFPLEPGRIWSQTASFTDARLAGAVNAGTDEYRFVVDGAGTARLPALTFSNTLRLRVELTRTLAIAVGANPSTLVQLSYLHECVGEVARIVSLPGTTEPDFGQALEFRRLGLP